MLHNYLWVFVMGTDQVGVRIGLHEIQIDPENGVCYTTAYWCLSWELTRLGVRIGLHEIQINPENGVCYTTAY